MSPRHCDEAHAHDPYLPATHTSTKRGDEVPMFENAREVTIHDGSFIVNVGTPQQNKLDQFLETASLNAILNAGGRADEVRCYPGTREEVIGKIEGWRDGQHEPDRRILWLSGHAGAGKSAIAQTVAERECERGDHAANFFFFRGDHTRNHAHSVVATLIYQLVNFYPELYDRLTTILKSQPLAHQASVGEQFSKLLASPIESVHLSTSVDRKITLIVDGLDECNDESAQVQILNALHKLVSRDGSPFRVFVASRTEPHLVMFFNKIASSVESLFLSDEYRPADDIRKFVAAKFDEIKRTHHLAHRLGANWPTEADIDQITDKSSGQFIFAATVMRFIEYSRDSPSLSLLTVLQLRAPTNHSPFAQLDALYSYVFSKARDIRALKWALGFEFMRIPNSSYRILLMAGYDPLDLESLFTDISAIALVSIPGHGSSINVEFYHASLPDYLRDQPRSGVYHVDEGEIAADAMAVCLHKFSDLNSFDQILSVSPFLKEPTAELSKSLLDAAKRNIGRDLKRSDSELWVFFVKAIIELYFATDKDLCTRILRGWIRFAYIHKIDPEIEKKDVDKTSYKYYERLRRSEKATVAVRRG